MAQIVIIGGGASGLIAALIACQNNNEVTIIESNKDLGKKILVTGNGHCNYFHENIEASKYHSNNEELIKNIINEKNVTLALNYLNHLGIIPKIKNGYYYPYSNQAISVKNALVNAIKRNNIKVITETEVLSINKTDNFTITSDRASYIADKVIIATGGMAAPKTGSTGKGYKLATNLGHSIIKPLPALSGLKIDANIKEISGVRSEIKITLLEEGKKVQEEIGELQHNDYGISGICAMQLSSRIARGLDEGLKEEVIINYIPSIALDSSTFITWFSNYQNKLPNMKLSEFLDQILNYKLTNFFLKTINLDPNIELHNLKNDELNKIANILTEFRLNVIGTNSFDNAQTTSGGIPLTEVNIYTLESKIVPNLYFCGEILDIDGACGGYNLGAAWITGLIAGTNASKEVQK
ncbi:MAG: aminoacetone oxidase family FAD-binding enzyme [Bacilli bacterium]